MVDAPLGELPKVVRGRDALVAELLGIGPERRRAFRWLARRQPGKRAGAEAIAGQVRVVAGLGGSGKTTVALTAAESARRLGWRVWWVSAVDSSTLVAGMTALAVEIGATADEVAQADSESALAALVWSRLERSRWQMLAPHAQALLGYAGILSRERIAELVKANNGLTHHLAASGTYAAALDLAQTVLAVAEQALGPEDPDTLTSRNNLANAYHAAGRLTDAIHLLEPTLTASENTLGLDHPTTVVIRNNLAAARRQRDETT